LKQSDVVSVACLSVDEILSAQSPLDYATAGIHPWWVEDYSLEKIENLKKAIEKLLAQGKVWGIGETGIDRGYPESLEQQKNLFHWHLELSEKHQLPLIVHSVRAGADFLQILKDKSPRSPWIFHDFRGSQQLLNDLVRLHSHCYFSFGISIDNSPQIRELLPLVAPERIFLETDEQKHLDIHDITVRAAHHLQMDVDSLKSQIWKNFRKISPLTLH
jgi:TatD DNase family protein